MASQELAAQMTTTPCLCCAGPLARANSFPAHKSSPASVESVSSWTPFQQAAKASIGVPLSAGLQLPPVSPMLMPESTFRASSSSPPALQALVGCLPPTPMSPQALAAAAAVIKSPSPGPHPSAGGINNGSISRTYQSPQWELPECMIQPRGMPGNATLTHSLSLPSPLAPAQQPDSMQSPWQLAVQAVVSKRNAAAAAAAASAQMSKLREAILPPGPQHLSYSPHVPAGMHSSSDGRRWTSHSSPGAASASDCDLMDLFEVPAPHPPPYGSNLFHGVSAVAC